MRLRPPASDESACDASARWAILQCYIKIVAGTLFVVATPIGNLEDITLRALRILREVDLVAAEDTRRTGNLLRHYQIATPLVSLHEHNERGRIPQVLERLRAGQSVALVSDAGTPGISDPGAELVNAARSAGYPVIPVPGASSVSAIMSVSGVSDTRFVFAGFPPYRSKDRKQWLSGIAADREHAIICFEAPHRVKKTLEELGIVLGDRPILVGREVTKVHEEWRQGSAHALATYFSEPQGEFVLLVQPAPEITADSPPPTDNQIADLFGHITNNGAVDRRDALRATAERLQIPVKTVYAAVERVKKLAD